MSPAASSASFMSPAASTASSGFGSSGSAASFMSPKPKYKPCTHMKASSSVHTCKQCWNEYNTERRLIGLPNEAYRGRCEHGINYNTPNACKELQCQKKPRPYGAKQEAARQSPLPPVVASAASAGLNPHPRGLSLSEFKHLDPKHGLINYKFETPSPLAPVLPGETSAGLLHAPHPDHEGDVYHRLPIERKAEA